MAGPIRPWFEMPGYGTQFLASSSVNDLIQRGFLKRLTQDGYDEPSDFVDGYSPGPESS